MKKPYYWSLFVLLIIPVLFTFYGCSGGSDKTASAAKEKVWIEQWKQQRPMTQKRAGLAAVAVGNRIYAIGGGEFKKGSLEIFDTVEYADVLEDGTLSEWKPGPSLNVPRIYVTSAVYNGYVYVMGGESSEQVYTGVKTPPKLLDSIERAKINPDGTLGEWVLEKERMNLTRRGGEFYAHNGWLYALGGFNGLFLNEVERAKINPDGSVGKWIPEEHQLTKVRYISGFFNKGPNLYVIGGHINSPQRAMESIETATAQKDGTLTKWKETTPLYTRRFLNTSLLVGDTVYSIAGHNTVNLSVTEKARVLEDGSLTPGEPDTPINTPRRATSSVVVGDTLYVLGGMVLPLGLSDSINEVESAIIAPDKNLGNWVVKGSAEEKAYKEWKETTPIDVKNHLKHAYMFMSKKEYDTALYDISEALKQWPKSFEAYSMKGDILYRMGKKDEAVEALKKSVEINDKNFYALMGLGNITFDRKDYEEAKKYYKMAVDAQQESVTAHYNLGNAYLNSSEYAKAADEFRWVLTKEPNSVEAKHLLDLALKSGKEN